MIFDYVSVYFWIVNFVLHYDFLFKGSTQ